MVVVSLIALVYFGSIVDPAKHLDGLPVLLVHQGSGAAIGVNDRVEAALRADPAVDGPLALTTTTLRDAKARMDDGRAYATVVLQGGGSAVEVLTNVRNGSVGVELATEALEPALVRAYAGIGSASGRPAVRVTPYRPLPANAGLGLGAFYLALLATMCGFLGATIVQSTVDSATGYTPSETGPRWKQRMPVRITRWQTILAKWCMVAVLVPLLTALVVLMAVVVLGLDAPGVGFLWLYMTFGAVVVSVGTLTLLAIFGTLGQLLALMLFVYLAMSASGGTIPREALPAFFRAFSYVDPLRQIIDGVRAIVYFDGAMAAGLARGLVMTAVGLVFWLVLGAVVTRWYDRRGQERLTPGLLARIEASAVDVEIDAPPA